MRSDLYWEVTPEADIRQWKSKPKITQHAMLVTGSVKFCLMQKQNPIHFNIFSIVCSNTKFIFLFGCNESGFSRCHRAFLHHPCLSGVVADKRSCRLDESTVLFLQMRGPAEFAQNAGNGKFVDVLCFPFWADF